MEGNDGNYRVSQGGSIETRSNIPSTQSKEVKKNELKPQPEVAEEGPSGATYFGVRSPGETDFNKDDAIFPKQP